MSRHRTAPLHPQATLFEDWRTDRLKDSALAFSTVRVYAHDVARFLRALKGKPLDQVSSNVVANFLSRLDRRSRSRMLSALGDFFAFAFTKGVLDRDPLRSLKYRRSHAAVEAQMDFFDLLTEAGVRKPEILIWADFVEPLVKRQERRLRVKGRLVELRPAVWNRLEVRFRNLAASCRLQELLTRRIAS